MCKQRREEKCNQSLIRKNLKERDEMEDLSTNGKILIKLILKIQDGRLWTGFIWLKTGVRLLCAR
jgi:hypothetical protein